MESLVESPTSTPLAAPPRTSRWLERQLTRLRCGAATRALAHGAVATLLARACGLFVALFFQWAFARWLGAEAFGDFMFALSLLGVFVLLGKCGGDGTTLRFVPIYLQQSQPERLQAFRRWRDRRSILLCSALAAVGAGMLWLFGSYLSAGLRATCWWGLAALLPAVLIELRAADLRAARWTGFSDVAGILVRPVMALLLGILAVTALRWEWTAAKAMLLYVAAGIIALVFVGWLSVRCLRAIPWSLAALTHDERAQWRGMAMPLLLLAGFNLALGQTDILLLGWLEDTRTAGVYGVAVRLAGLVAFGLVAMSSVFAPLWSQLYASGEHTAMKRLAAVMSLALLACTLPAALVMVVAGRPLLHLFGTEFIAAYPALVLLACGQLANALAGPVCHLLNMSGHQRTTTRVLGAFALVHFASSWCLITHWSLWGAALATTLTMIGWNVTLAVLVYRRLGINSTLLGASILWRNVEHA